METTETRLQVVAAPLQGFTDEVWRCFHRRVYGDSVERYYTPFLRVEKGQVRTRDVRGLRSDLNAGVPVVPQVIFNSIEEFVKLIDVVEECGFRAVDMNMGCPFPPQVHHGRGSALLRRPELLEEITGVIRERYPQMEFSAKMRLGVERPDEWRGVIGIINAMNLMHVTVHPRVATQQYRGELYTEEFRRLRDECRHPVIFNGDVTSVNSIEKLQREYAGLKTVMIGRGMLMRPSLAAEYAEGEEWNRVRRIDHIMQLHTHLYDYYIGSLSGDAHVLQKMKPFWEYLEAEIGHKAFKQIKKATTLAKYLAAVGSVE